MQPAAEAGLHHAVFILPVCPHEQLAELDSQVSERHHEGLPRLGGKHSLCLSTDLQGRTQPAN